MADRFEEDELLQMAIHMSLHTSPPDPKLSKPRQGCSVIEESPEAREQRVLRAAAEERRMLSSGRTASFIASPNAAGKSVIASSGGVEVAVEEGVSVSTSSEERREAGCVPVLEEALPLEVAEKLFYMVFGSDVSRDILGQWSNQGIRFSSDPETSMGLVQHEGGPCGVLATIQAYVLKYLLFFLNELSKSTPSILIQNIWSWRFVRRSPITLGDFASVSVDEKIRALVLSMVEILFLCGKKKRAVVAILNVPSHLLKDEPDFGHKDEMISKALEGLTIESASDLQRILKIKEYTSQLSAFLELMELVPVFQSRMGAMLFLISALLSRGLDLIQADRDDPTLPLVTAPFGHASQEIVNLLLCGQAAPNVFDGRMDLGGGMFLNGIPDKVEIGFLSLLESLNFCNVGQNLKHPRWPIWVVGSDSHYTVLFSPDITVQDENEYEERESKIRRAFNAQDQSGGGGFVSVEGIHQVLHETNINFPPEKLESLCSVGFIVWSEFLQGLLELDKDLGGLKDSSGMMGWKRFDIYHFNGIAKSVLSGNQKPRLCKLRVSVPPKWSPEDFMVTSGPSDEPGGRGEGKGEVSQPEPPQYAPLVDCIRTRWPRAICNWVGDPPTIV
ncbi:hypothetical protein QJS04_geneDACA008635 [Acorus gramineus]|uniref:ubiquitinyl hydrolase 1 n=1 Tax=Acorus gramineus TaxID=55184 RepID=A0AAV9AH99_ACOGR|nr:hypothetical protein QJS04_geneDACA008635 [Acorus gramineus]